MHFIDVGQGNSILIQAPNGKNMLVDGGAKASGAKVVSFLKSKGVKRLDYVVVTHPDADHIGGLIAVFYCVYRYLNELNFISIGLFKGVV